MLHGRGEHQKRDVFVIGHGIVFLIQIEGAGDLIKIAVNKKKMIERNISVISQSDCKENHSGSHNHSEITQNTQGSAASNPHNETYQIHFPCNSFCVVHISSLRTLLTALCRV